MAENWTGIAAEVDEAIRSIADVSQPGGYLVTLRKVTVTGGNPFDPTSGTTTIVYHTLYAVEDNREVRDINGTLIGETRRTLMVNATGVVPSDDDRVFVGDALVFQDEAADGAVAWVEIAAVRPLAPAGVAVLYEIDLVN
jgi:hypothetical protein